MALDQQRSFTLAAPDDDGICAAQTKVGAGDLTLNGVLVSSGTFTVSDKCAKQIAIASTGNISATTFTVYGTLLPNSPVTSEAVTGPNNSTVETTNYFHTVTRVAVSGNVSTNTTVGTSDEAVTPPILCNRAAGERTVSVELSGTINVDLQHCLSDVLALGNDGTYSETTADWIDNDASTPLTSLTSGHTAVNYTAPVMAYRLVTNSYSSTPTMVIRVIEPGVE